MQNCDVWGLITVYNDIINQADMLGAGRSGKVKQLRLLVMRYLYSPEFAGKPIDVDILIKELKDIMPFSSTTKKVNVVKNVNKSTDSKEKNVQDYVSTGSVNSSSLKKKTRRKRCKNGTRRNKKTGECEEINRVSTPTTDAEPVVESSDDTGSLLESIGLFSKPEKINPVVKKTKGCYWREKGYQCGKKHTQTMQKWFSSQ